MKSSFIIILSFFSLLFLVSCGQKNIDSQEVEVVTQNEITEQNSEAKEVEEEVVEMMSDSGSAITLNDFKENSVLENDSILIGTLPTTWVINNSFPILIMTLDGDIIQEISAFAEVVDEEGSIATGDIQFVADMQFTVPQGINKGKLLFKSANPQASSDDILEIEVTFSKVETQEETPKEEVQ